MTKIDCKKIFNINCDFDVKSFEGDSKYVPVIDQNYIFDQDVTTAILAGFSFNKKVLIQGLHGTGKSTHIEQIAARLNYPLIRINLDSQITRLDLVGKDIIKLEKNKQVTEFKEGIIPFALRHGIALVLDEYDAMKPDVGFVIQRLLEENGKFVLLEENDVIIPHKNFRLFATSNTIGLGDEFGIYHGVNLINQAQMDRWNMVAFLNYLDEKEEVKILLKKVSILNSKNHLTNNTAEMMVRLANLTRESFKNGDISTMISLRTLISWGNNIEIFSCIAKALKFSFYNRINNDEKPIIEEFYQRVFGDKF